MAGRILQFYFSPPGHFFAMCLHHRVHDLREIPENF